MREYLNRKLIVETLKSHPGQAFSTHELGTTTEIPVKTLRSILRHLVHENIVQKKALNIQPWNKKKTHKFEQTRVWYYIKDKDVFSKQPLGISTQKGNTA